MHSWLVVFLGGGCRHRAGVKRCLYNTKSQAWLSSTFFFRGDLPQKETAPTVATTHSEGVESVGAGEAQNERIHGSLFHLLSVGANLTLWLKERYKGCMAVVKHFFLPG